LYTLGISPLSQSADTPSLSTIQHAISQLRVNSGSGQENRTRGRARSQISTLHSVTSEGDAVSVAATRGEAACKPFAPACSSRYTRNRKVFSVRYGAAGAPATSRRSAVFAIRLMPGDTMYSSPASNRSILRLTDAHILNARLSGKVSPSLCNLWRHELHASPHHVKWIRQQRGECPCHNPGPKVLCLRRDRIQGMLLAKKCLEPCVAQVVETRKGAVSQQCGDDAAEETWQFFFLCDAYQGTNHATVLSRKTKSRCSITRPGKPQTLNPKP
jgi:hypothetical protein